MKNRIGVVSCHLIGLLPVEETFLRLVSYGITEVEWFVATDYQEKYGEDIFEKICQFQECYGLTASYHAPYLGPWNLGLVSRSEAKKKVRRIIELAEKFNAQSITLHPGSHQSGEAKNSRCQALRQVVEVLVEFIPFLEQKGLRVNLENNTLCYDPAALGTRIDDFSFFFELLPNSVFGLALDTGHSQVMRITEELLARFPRYLFHTHLHDNDGHSDSHLPPGEGIFDWKKFFGLIKKIGYAGPLVIEFPEKTEKYPEFIRLIREA
ncbi:MAG: sugar phosphate isomerase/epimerase [Candidatus Omnitrophica bacterium]|nr:sugar phosphate isomerase/epimerase [Candidatus Omnitrophota bacterium]